MPDYNIIIEPLGLRGKCLDNESILSCARRLGVGINSVCGGKGTCHSCKVQVTSGTFSDLTQSEGETFTPQEIENGWRLACQIYPASDCKIRVPADSMTTSQRTQVEGLEVKVEPEPPVQSYHLQLQAPSSSDQRADAERLLETLNQRYQLQCNKIDNYLLRLLSPKLRSLNWDCQVSVRKNEVISIGPRSSYNLGLAVDLGTTKIAGYLVDLKNGKTLGSKGIMNPQISFGEDIISRISLIINKPKEAVHLQKLVIDVINQLAAELCTAVSVGTEEIVEAVVIGNTAMHHIFLGISVKQLAVSPFIPAISRSLDVKARELGLNMAPGAYVHVPPNIAGFVGADHVAMLVATQGLQNDGPVICLDIGTNTEVSLINNGEISTVSCASGPAFEGGHIKHGMRAGSGAIERFRIEKGDFQYQVIDDAPPIGLCGSGILDAIAQLHLAEIIDRSGRIQDNNPRVRTQRKQREIVLVDKVELSGQPDIVITQQDVREIQLAKAAIRTGIEVLLEVSACSDEEIKQVVIAGAFGSYIDINSALTIGMFPPLQTKQFQQVGNAAGTGAKLILSSLTKRSESEMMVSGVRYIELASAPDFIQVFNQASYLGQYRIESGKGK
ncbi:ASKHA domain-containing protein [Chloroflexota bacterium]